MSVETETLKGIARAYVINLDRREDRLKSFYGRLPQAFAKIMQRFPAIDGAKLGVSPELIRLFRSNDFQFRRNTIGCSLSHYEIWKRIRDDETLESFAAIFEDDAWFSNRLLELWNGLMFPLVPEGADVIYIGGLVGPPSEEELALCYEIAEGHPEVPHDRYVGSMINPHFARPVTSQFCLYSYLLSRAGAQKLCDLVKQTGFHRAVDWFVIDHWPDINASVTVPTLCWAAFKEQSDIQNSHDTLFSELAQTK